MHIHNVGAAVAGYTDKYVLLALVRSKKVAAGIERQDERHAVQMK